jgi:hypothetical protein
MIMTMLLTPVHCEVACRDCGDQKSSCYSSAGDDRERHDQDINDQDINEYQRLDVQKTGRPEPGVIVMIKDASKKPAITVGTRKSDWKD